MVAISSSGLTKEAEHPPSETIALSGAASKQLSWAGPIWSPSAHGRADFRSLVGHRHTFVRRRSVNAAVNFPKSAEVKFPNYADGVVMERWLFFGGRPLGFGGGVKAGGVISAFERTCSGMSSAC